MEQKSTLNQIDLQRLRDWLPTVSAHLVPVYKPEFFVEMGFPLFLVQQYVEKFRPVCAKGSTEIEGVSGGVFLQGVAEVLGADTSEADRLLSLSNRIEVWRNACIKRVDEILGQDQGTSDG